MKSKLQEMADLIREGTEHLTALEKDRDNVQDRIKKISKEIETLRNQEKDLWFELECCNAAVDSQGNQIEAAKRRVMDIVGDGYRNKIRQDAEMPF